MSATGGGSGPSVAPVAVGPLTFGEIPGVMRLYRRQPTDSRALFHPLPFDRLRLFAFLAYVVAIRRIARRLLPHRGLRVALVLTARVGDANGPIAFGLVGFDRRGPSPRAVFGYLVDEQSRGRGVGTRLHEEMIDAALRLGVTRGGGTVLATNTPNLHLLTRLGFTITPTESSDSGAVGVPNLATDGDLAAISARFHSAARRPPLRPA